MHVFGPGVETTKDDQLGESGTVVHMLNLGHPFWGWSYSDEMGGKGEHNHAERVWFCCDEADVWVYGWTEILRSMNQNCVW